MIHHIFEKDSRTLRLIILTHGNCNFRCLYCYEKFENIGMNQKTMNSIFDFAEEKIKSGNFENFLVSLFGGEPLLGYKTIQYLSPKFQLLASQYGLNYNSDMTTNGYLLDNRKAQKLITDYKCTNFQITLDGTAESHDKQRVLQNGSSSFERIYKNLLNLPMVLVENFQ